jgi:hypothetical protein
MKRTYTLHIAAFLAAILGISRLNADTPAPPKTPTATPAVTLAPANVHHSLTEPIESFGQFILHPTDPYQVIPGKDPKGWSFTLEPYLWAMSISGDIGVKGFPASHVSFSPVDVLKHLDWGVMMKCEVRKGRWGILGDGFFAQLSGSGDPPGPLYDSVSVRRTALALGIAFLLTLDIGTARGGPSRRHVCRLRRCGLTRRWVRRKFPSAYGRLISRKLTAPCRLSPRASSSACGGTTRVSRTQGLA